MSHVVRECGVQQRLFVELTRSPAGQAEPVLQTSPNCMFSTDEHHHDVRDGPTEDARSVRAGIVMFPPGAVDGRVRVGRTDPPRDVLSDNLVAARGLRPFWVCSGHRVDMPLIWGSPPPLPFTLALAFEVAPNPLTGTPTTPTSRIQTRMRRSPKHQQLTTEFPLLLKPIPDQC